MPPTPRSPSVRKRILLIEDEEDIRDVLEYDLRKEGYDVGCAATGEQGLDAARTDGADLILLDLMLPGIDGLEVCRRLRSDAATKDVPIIMVTARGFAADVLRGREVGAAGYITKPITAEEVIRKVRAFLD